MIPRNMLTYLLVGWFPLHIWIFHELIIFLTVNIFIEVFGTDDYDFIRECRKVLLCWGQFFLFIFTWRIFWWCHLGRLLLYTTQRWIVCISAEHCNFGERKNYFCLICILDELIFWLLKFLTLRMWQQLRIFCLPRGCSQLIHNFL